MIKNIGHKKLHDVNRNIISSSLSGKIDKYDYLTSEEILPSGPSKIIEQAKSPYSPLGKTYEKQRQLNIRGKPSQSFTGLNFANKEALPKQDLISDKKIYPKILDELKRVEEDSLQRIKR